MAPVGSKASENEVRHDASAQDVAEQASYEQKSLHFLNVYLLLFIIILGGRPPGGKWHGRKYVRKYLRVFVIHGMSGKCAGDID